MMMMMMMMMMIKEARRWREKRVRTLIEKRRVCERQRVKNIAYRCT